MDKIGVLKEIDKVGRVVIPKDIRDRYSLYDEIEIVATSEGILIRSPEYCLVKRDVKEQIVKK